MFRVLFLILVLMSSITFAQTQDNKPQASNFDEFGKINNGEIKARIDSFFIELMNNLTAQGYIINYGLDRDIARRKRFLQNYVTMRNFDTSKITFVKGGILKEIKTELWIAPVGAEMPKATKFEEFGSVSNGELRYLTDKFFLELVNNSTVRGYIINYGKTKFVTSREKILRGRINLRNFDPSRITFIRGGNKKDFTTELWIVPQGAEPPIP